MTQAGTILGTAAYMSPEQAQGKPVDSRSDIFSFGLVLYEMLSGQRAFDEDTGLATMAAIVRDEPKPLTSTPDLQKIIARCLAKQPAQRYQTMAEIRTALASASLKSAEEQPSIAVLPFANMSGDKDNEYFSDGLSEEIINALAHMPGLKVTARTSAFAFRGKEQDITKIAETLRVKTVLEGSVRRAGNRIRVMAQLINASDGYHLWSERFDRDLTDVFAVQDEIAAAIAAALKVKLGGKPAPAHRHTPKLSAYEAYLKGLHHRIKNTPEANARAREFFQQAIALDPEYPDPHVGLADTAFLPWIMGSLPARDGALFVRTHVRKALDLDPTHPRAHAMLGSVAAIYEYDWKEAERQYGEALSAEPVPPGVMSMYCIHYLAPLGRVREGLDHLEKSIESDPLNLLGRYFLGICFSLAGKPERALQQASKILEIDDNSLQAFVLRDGALSAQERWAEALANAERVLQLAPGVHLFDGVLAGHLMRAGERSRAEDLIRELKGTPSPAIGMLLYHCACLELDAAADWFELAIEQRNPLVPSLCANPLTKPLRDSPRWPALAKVMNLPQH
jgi:serine/threonine-protein kinase